MTERFQRSFCAQGLLDEQAFCCGTERPARGSSPGAGFVALGLVLMSLGYGVYGPLKQQDLPEGRSH